MTAPTTAPVISAVIGTGDVTVNLVMAVTIGVLFATGFYLLLQRSLMRVLIGVVVLGHGTNLLLQIAGGPPARAPIVGTAPTEQFADPLPQALALTAVVITFALTTYLLALGYRSFVLVGHDEVQDDVEDRRIAARRVPSVALEDGSDATGDPNADPARDDERGDDERGDDERGDDERGDDERGNDRDAVDRRGASAGPHEEDRP